MSDASSTINNQGDKRKRKRRGPRLTGISKQRRLANARERKRVQTLNETIDVLKELLPLPEGEKNPTRTQVVWMAATYIGELTQMLRASESSRAGEFEEAIWPDLESLMGIDLDQLFDLESEADKCYNDWLFSASCDY